MRSACAGQHEVDESPVRQKEEAVRPRAVVPETSLRCRIELNGPGHGEMDGEAEV